MRALQVLHLGEEVAEMLAVLASLAEPGIRSVGRTIEGRLGEHFVDVPVPRAPHLLERRRDAALGHVAVERIRLEELHRVGPEPLERSLRAAVAFLRAVAEAYQPARAVAQVIPGLFQRFLR